MPYQPEATKAADGYVPPQPVRSAAKRGLELRAKYNRGGTAVGVARARDLSNGNAVSYDTIKRMNSFFARHEVDKKGEGWGKDSAGYIAWLLWGGDAGWSWAKRIIREYESREKSTMSDLTTAFFGIEKADRNPDGTITVFGKATDDSIDIDQQICDGDWLDRAMPHWFKSGGNIREQHSNIAAGVATEYEVKQDGHYISALVVDPVSVKKVEAGVLKGFSVGIKNPRVVRDTKAANGRIVDGQIVEVSLVDRPANPNCQLVLAKSAAADGTVIQVEDLIEDIVKHPGHGDQKTHGRGGNTPATAAGGGGSSEGGGGAGGGDREAKLNAAKKELDSKEKQARANYQSNGAGDSPAAQSHLGQADGHAAVRQSLGSKAKMEYTANKAKSQVSEAETDSGKAYAKGFKEAVDEGVASYSDLSKLASTGEGKALHSDSPEDKDNVMSETIEVPKSVLGELLKFDKAKYEAARDALADLVTVEAEEMKQGHDEIRSLSHLLEAISHLHAWYEGEEMEGEVIEESIEMSVMADDAEKTGGCKCVGCVKCMKGGGCDEMKCKGHDGMKYDKEAHGDEDDEADEADKTVEADNAKCLECGCHVPQDSHGLTQLPNGTNVSTATMVSPSETPKSAEPDTEVSVDEESPADIETIVEQVVESATKALKSEIASLVSAREAAEAKSMELESELAVAKSLAVAGGPKRTAKPLGNTQNELLMKAATYKAKANATTDPDLAKGYAALADKFTKEYDATLNKTAN